MLKYIQKEILEILNKKNITYYILAVVMLCGFLGALPVLQNKYLEKKQGEKKEENVLNKITKKSEEYANTNGEISSAMQQIYIDMLTQETLKEELVKGSLPMWKEELVKEYEIYKNQILIDMMLNKQRYKLEDVKVAIKETKYNVPDEYFEKLKNKNIYNKYIANVKYKASKVVGILQKNKYEDFLEIKIKESKDTENKDKEFAYTFLKNNIKLEDGYLKKQALELASKAEEIEALNDASNDLIQMAIEDSKNEKSIEKIKKQSIENNKKIKVIEADILEYKHSLITKKDITKTNKFNLPMYSLVIIFATVLVAKKFSKDLSNKKDILKKLLAKYISVILASVMCIICIYIFSCLTMLLVEGVSVFKFNEATTIFSFVIILPKYILAFFKAITYILPISAAACTCMLIVSVIGSPKAGIIATCSIYISIYLLNVFKCFSICGVNIPYINLDLMYIQKASGYLYADLMYISNNLHISTYVFWNISICIIASIFSVLAIKNIKNVEGKNA
ncbi:MAG: hypothetical protein RR922_04025 [Clostridia bacterium]